VALTAIGLASCGGGEPDPLTKTEFLKQGNEACLQATAERGSATKEAVKDPQSSEGASEEAEFDEFVTNVLLPPVQQMTDDLDGLGVPKGDEKQVEGIVAGFQNGIDELEGDPSSATANSFTAANKRAVAYGLTDCVI
jgi:hypothetical protein